MFKKTFLLLFAATCFVIVINSCKKDSRKESQNTVSDPEIAQAKSWYESIYPINTNKLSTQAVSSNLDFNKLIKPDWNHAACYLRFDKKTIELPIDPSSTFHLSIKNLPGAQGSNQAFSRSSFLLISNGKNYNAYIMTIIADSTYLKKNLSKLDANRYNKQDADFSGVVLYNTPEGKFVTAYTYKNGRGISKISASVRSDRKAVQSLDGKLKTNEIICTDIVQDAYWNGVYVGSVVLGQTCYDISSFPNPNDGGGGNGGGDGFPPPDQGGGSSDPGLPNSPVSLKIDVDTLMQHFPCAVKLVIDNLASCGLYSDMVAPFVSSQRPDLVYKDGALPWNAPVPNSTEHTYQLGQTGRQTQGIGQSATITLNTAMLQNSSKLLIAAAVLHETIHAYINYSIVTAEDNAGQGYVNFTGDNWLLSMDNWCSVEGLPSNYTDHYQMMSVYFDKAVDALRTWDNAQHTNDEYAKAMLYGLDNPGADATAAQKAVLAQEFNYLKSSYHFTDAQLNSFNQANLNATSATKLPGNCN